MKKEKKIKMKSGRIGFLMPGFGKWANKTPKLCLIDKWGKYEFTVYYPEFDEIYSHLSFKCASQFEISEVKMSISDFKKLYSFLKFKCELKRKF